MAILASVQAGDVSLPGSEALDYEASRIPNDERRSQVTAILAFASEYVEMIQSYSTIRSQLKTGDLVLCCGKGSISAGIKWVTHSR